MDLNKFNDLNLTFKFANDLCPKPHFELFNQGSEARVYKGTFLGKPSILKERFVKTYRHTDLDKTLTAERMKAEVRALNKCFDIGVKCPAVYFADLSCRYIILQEITDCVMVKEYLEFVMEKDGSDSINKQTVLAEKIGEGIAKMHANELVHGDLTTSNLLIQAEDLNDIGKDFEVYFIDFGLSKRDVTLEDLAVDLYVLERAISSSHPNSDDFYALILKQYLKWVGDRSTVIFNKLEEVKLRGRKRSMLG
ncbi:hypothetical protein JTE90_006864 [Oedothorax gibbosus]|uniref:non-specific serine/threonine protein kinase n=1 Tax=Oedothorax gibbosus TaxID=931172 RepID=A0AAV6UJJ0_9ARAC|nr:hypothetical protein JTE90_006864 [Oedothorax gibbosus]